MRRNEFERMNKSKTLAKRRDRRKAKQTEFKRPGKSNMSKVGHGGSGQKVTKKQSNQQTNPRHIGENIADLNKAQKIKIEKHQPEQFKITLECVWKPEPAK